MIRTTSKPTVLIVGANGFVGRHILQSMGGSSHATVRATSRRAGATLGPDVETIHLDLADLASIAQATRGATAVINAAAYVGTDPLQAAATNVVGTANLLQICQDEGITRYVQLSSMAVYGTGPHAGTDPEQLRPRPQSTTSLTRAAADELVLSSGGAVIRAGLTYGAGDRWFLPALARMNSILDGTPRTGKSRLSVIDVRDLAAMASTLACREDPATGIFHAANPTPESIEKLLQRLNAVLGTPDRASRVPPAEAHAMLRSAGFTDHQSALLTADHWYQTDTAWQHAGLLPRAFGLTGDSADWYRSHLRAAPSS